MSHKRREEDVLKLKSGSLSLDEMKAWIVDLFYGRGRDSFRIPGDVFELWMGEVLANYSKAKDQKTRSMIAKKVLHTKEVVVAGVDIMTRTGEVDWDPYMVCTVCILHDIGRFEQALIGSYSDTISNFNHALEGAKKVERVDLTEMEMMGISKEMVVEAVKTHSGIGYSGNNEYAKLARDADKLALLRYMPYLFKEYTLPHDGVNPKVMEAYKNKEMAKSVDMKSYADHLIGWLCWEVDFNFEATKYAFYEEDLREWIVDTLREEGVDL